MGGAAGQTHPEAEFLASPSGIATAQVSADNYQCVIRYTVDGIRERGVGELAYTENECSALADLAVRTRRAPPHHKALTE